MKQQTKQPSVAIISLTSCEGCEFVMLDQGNRLLKWLQQVNLGEFRLIEELPMTAEHFDICFVEGNPVTKANITLLKKMRKMSDLLVVVGNCAALGGVWELKNYVNKQKTVRQIYRKTKVENPDIKEVDNFVTVDLTIPGCPIDGQEFMEIAEQLVQDRMPRIPNKPVCWECQNHGYECLLQKGEICLGPITLGGCQAVCLKSKQACWGCRGLFEGAKIKNLMTRLLKEHPKEQVDRVMEVFGCKDSILKALQQEVKSKKKK